MNEEGKREKNMLIGVQATAFINTLIGIKRKKD